MATPKHKNKADVPPAPGSHLTDAEVTSYFRALLPDFYFVNTPLSRMRRHLGLLERLPLEKVIVDFQRPPGAHYTELTLCAYDAAEPGLLSKVAGTLTALKINVHTAWIHTLTDPTPGPERRVVLDTLILSEPYLGRTRPLSSRTQARISEQIKAVLDGTTNLTLLLARQSSKIYSSLAIYELNAGPGPEDWTLIKLRAEDNNGVLYRITRALAALELNIAHAQINTFEKSVEDVFFVSSTGGHLSPEEVEQKAGQIRAILYNDALLTGLDKYK